MDLRFSHGLSTTTISGRKIIGLFTLVVDTVSSPANKASVPERWPKNIAWQGIVDNPPRIAFCCCTMSPQKSAHMHMLYNAPSGLRGHCKTNIMHENGEFPLILHWLRGWIKHKWVMFKNPPSTTSEQGKNPPSSRPGKRIPLHGEWIRHEQ